ncbi:MAG: cyaB [Gemmatimonadetes bacterium]|nr:cyaB [Gemmatimonadota bacterium]
MSKYVSGRLQKRTPIPTTREALAFFWRLVQLMRPFWGLLAKGTAMSISISVVGMITPYFSKIYFDRVYPTRDITLLQVLVVGSVTLTITSAFMTAVRGYYSMSIGAQLNRSISLMFFNHLQHLTIRFFDQHRVGEIYSRFGNVSASIKTVTGTFETVMLNCAFLILVPPLLLFMNPRVALLSLITVPITTTLSTISSRWVRRYSQRGMETNAELSAFQIETLSNIRIVKGLAAEPFVFRLAQEQLHAAMELSFKSGALGVSVGFVNAVLRTLGLGAFTYVAWTQIIHQDMTLGDFMAFSMYVGYLTGPVGSVASMFMDFQTSAVSFGRMFEYLDLPVEQDPSLAFKSAKPISHRLAGDFALRDITFQYTPEKAVLRNVSMSVARGSLSAIVGPSGAGKSSVLRLISGLERPQVGEIWFGDTRSEAITLPDIRRQIAAVWQEVSLMRGTIRDNLTYALDDVSEERLDEVLRVCRLTELIAEQPLGMETTVAEFGATLSGGQRQRLAIARALLRDAPILTLDEATSNIDVSTESEILRDVFSRARGTTIVFVTHRVSTAVLADRIFVMDAGCIVGAGTHPELMDSCQVYRDLYTAGTAPPDDQRRLRALGGDPPFPRKWGG